MAMEGMSQTRASAQAPGQRTRVGGSAFTVFLWQGNIIGWANQTSVVSPTPVGSGATPIHPMDVPRPIDIITPAAQNIGTMTLEMWELYNRKVWERLIGLAGTPDLANVFLKMAAFGDSIKLAKLIRPPVLAGVNPANASKEENKIVEGSPQYGELYEGVTITNIEDGETINIGTMDLIKRVTIAYTHMVPFSPTGSQYRDLAGELARNSISASLGKLK